MRTLDFELTKASVIINVELKNGISNFDSVLIFGIITMGLNEILLVIIIL
jgi:hypothetical protein